MSDSDFSVVGARVALKEDLERRSLGGLQFPLGVFPCGADSQMQEGYESRAQLGAPGLSDHIEYRVLLSPAKLSLLFGTLLDELMPSEVFGIYEEFSFDAFRDTDSYMSSDAVPLERLKGAWTTYRDFIVEDGKTGFGAVSFDPCLELFIEEHGCLYISGAVEYAARIEALLEANNVQEVATLRTIDNFEHQHREILRVEEEDDSTMDEVDVKFSIIESLGMVPSNRDEGIPDALPTPYWVQVELDLTFKADSVATGAYVSYGVTADSYDEAIALVEKQLLNIQGALLARFLDVYRIAESNISDDICPADRSLLTEIGLWFNGELQLWV